MRRALLLGGLLFAVHAASASALSVTVNCEHLQGELNAAVAGETITLDEVCKKGFPYKLPAVPMTLAGTAGAGFSGGTTVQVEGGGRSATIEGLTFEKAKASGSTGGGLYIPSGGGLAKVVVLARDEFLDDTVEAPTSKSTVDGGGAEINTTGASVTVSDSTFIGDTATGGSEGSSGGGGLAVFATEATLTGDTFTGDAAAPNGVGGGLLLQLAGGQGSLAGSAFSDDTATDVGGGASIGTNLAGGTGASVTGNTFSHDAVADPAETSTDLNGYAGGGLSVEAYGVEPTTIAQSGNVFESNSVSFKAAPAMANGGGEAVDDAMVSSAADHFTDNTLQPPDEAEDKASKKHVFGWGAGLSVISCGDTELPPTTAPDLHSTLADALVAGNTLASGPSASGAGIYIGVLVCPAAYSVLDLVDSTVSGNAISGVSGAAGIAGGPHDSLSLQNTIVDGDSGGPELGGFSSLAGVNAAYSDVCSGAAPFAGAGNICAAPALVNAAGGDVHETTASPTLDRGSLSLIPVGLSTDTYGASRIDKASPCITFLTAVDIGAAEHGFPFPVEECAAGLVKGAAIAPVLSALSESAKTWREGTALAQLSSARRKRPPLGTTFTFTLSEAATVRLAFTTSAHGRRVGRHCVAQTRRNRHRHPCVRTVAAGSLTVAAHAGLNKLRFDGVLTAHRRLAKGKTYTMRLTASSAGGSSAAQTLKFTIAR